MLTDISDLQFEPGEAVALRLAQIAILAMDIDATEPSVREPKQDALRTLIQDSLNWAHLVGVEDHFAQLAASTDARVLRSVVRRLPILDLRRADMAELILLEILTLTTLPKGSKWSIKLDGPAANLVQEAFPTQTLHLDTARLRKLYRQSLRALSRDATSPVLRLGLVGGTLVIAAASGGLVAAVGTAIGGSMGVSGAAATTAGLAWLGGGTSTVGGFGVGGGAFIVTTAAKETYAGVRHVATMIAAHYSQVLVAQIAKLCVACDLHPSLTTSVLKALHDLAGEIETESQTNPSKELRKSRRAIAAAVRRIEDAGERPYRLARMVTRTFPVPGANKMLDAVRRRQRDRA